MPSAQWPIISHTSNSSKICLDHIHHVVVFTRERGDTGDGVAMREKTGLISRSTGDVIHDDYYAADDDVSGHLVTSEIWNA